MKRIITNTLTLLSSHSPMGKRDKENKLAHRARQSDCNDVKRFHFNCQSYIIFIHNLFTQIDTDCIVAGVCTRHSVDIIAEGLHAIKIKKINT